MDNVKKLATYFQVLLILTLFMGLVSPTAKSGTIQSNLSEKNEYTIALDGDLSGVTIGLYESYYSSTDNRIELSRTALYNMFMWMNATVHILNRTDILYGALWACEILCIPEGLGPYIQSSLGYDAMDMIKEWIALGGSYIGVRGSSTIAFSDGYFEGSSETFYMDLINGTSIGMPSYGYIVMSELALNKDIPDGPDFSEFPNTMNVFWRTGRYFEANEGQEMITLASYTWNDEPAIVAAKYGDGNVLASSPQFEFEEDDDRDGVDYYDDTYDDPDSEWPLVMEICKWMIEDSPTVANTTTWTYPEPEDTSTTTIPTNTTDQPMIIPMETIVVTVGVIAAVAIIAAVVLMKRR